MTGLMPCSCNHLRIQSAEYPLSPASFSGCSGQAVASSISAVNCWLSCSCPGPTRTASGVPSPSQIKCNLVLNPPWLRPKAWSAGSSLGRFFFRGPSRRLVRPNHAAIDGKEFPVNLVALNPAGLQMPQDAVPQARAGPFAKTIIHRLPRSETLGHVAPAPAIGQGPEDAINHEPMLFPLAAALSIGREEILDFLPLFVSKLVRRR